MRVFTVLLGYDKTKTCVPWARLFRFLCPRLFFSVLAHIQIKQPCISCVSVAFVFFFKKKKEKEGESNQTIFPTFCLFFLFSSISCRFHHKVKAAIVSNGFPFVSVSAWSIFIPVLMCTITVEPTRFLYMRKVFLHISGASASPSQSAS